MDDQLNVLIVGAGAAGIGSAIVLKELGVPNVLVVDRHEIGASFKRWPKGMRFITPSFNSNNFGTLDLNSIALHTSPAYSMRTEHPTGEEYARYLEAVADHYGIAVDDGVDVSAVHPTDDGFTVITSKGVLEPSFVIWAAGEFQYPRDRFMPGAQYGLHNSQVRDWSKLQGSSFVVIGGYESGMDAATQLVGLGKKVTVLDRLPTWNAVSSDPSLVLSPFTLDRVRAAVQTGRLTLRDEANITAIKKTGRGYAVMNGEKTLVTTLTRPILATGFRPSARLIADLFTWREDGLPELSEQDESTVAPGLFLVGPSVRQRKVVFCFIYKFRQRFAIVADQIAQRLGFDRSRLDEYRKRGLYLDDLSCCDEECAC
jgi:cation diffusion facilitator CzcD-associated flavoprotein CzcO